jgi:hypothetical protein
MTSTLTKLGIVAQDNIPFERRRQLPADRNVTRVLFSSSSSTGICALDAGHQSEGANRCKAMFETHSSDNVSAQTERSSLAAAQRRRSSFANLTQLMFGASFSSGEDRSEVSDSLASRAATRRRPSMTSMLFGLGYVDEDIIEDDDDDRGTDSIPVDESPYRFEGGREQQQFADSGK